MQQVREEENPMTKIIFVFPRDSEVVDLPERDAMGVIADDGEKPPEWYAGPLPMEDPLRLYRQRERRENENASCHRCGKVMEDAKHAPAGWFCRDEECSQRHILIHETCSTCHHRRPTPGTDRRYEAGALYCVDCGTKLD